MALMLALFWAPSLCAQEAPVESLKAAFLYRFAQFVEWPTNAFAADTTPLTLGVLGDDDFASKLGSLLKDKKAHNRSFVVKRIAEPADAAACHIVFVAAREGRRAAQVVEATRKKPVLLVGESDEFLDAGGMINIVKEEKQQLLRFDINPLAAEQANLTVSSHLLRLARKKTSKAGGAE